MVLLTWMKCAKNAKLVGNDEPDLKYMWEWLQGAREAAQEDGMVASGLDLSYLGLMSIWRPKFSTSRILGNYDVEPDMNICTAAVGEINVDNGRHPIKYMDTKFPEQRTMGLAICGWDFETDADLEMELVRLENKGKYAKAAGWALFHGKLERCIKALSRGGPEMKLMSTAVAGYQSNNGRRRSTYDKRSDSNDTWKELCRDMAMQMDDPYQRAIFAFITNGDWQDVLDEQGLPYRERLGIALRFLEDDEVSLSPLKAIIPFESHWSSWKHTSTISHTQSFEMEIQKAYFLPESPRKQ